MNSMLSPLTRTGYVVLGIVVLVVGTLIVDVLRRGGVAPPAQSPQGATQPPADEVRRLEVERQREAERKQEEARRQEEERRLAAQKAETERFAEEQRKAEELRSQAEQFPFGRTFSVVARVAINSAVATDRSRVGDIVGALPIEPIAFSGDSSVSAPSEFSLRVAALAPRSGDREAAIVLEPIRLNLQDGRVFIIEGESIVVAKDESAKGDWLKRLGKIAIGAGVGAAAGAALGGKGNRAEGAALGATAGGAVASVTLITRRNHIEAPRGYPLVFTMSSARLNQSAAGRLPGEPASTRSGAPTPAQCYVGIWEENNRNEFRWRMEVSGERLRIQRTDGFVSGDFARVQSGWRGRLAWANGDIWDGVVLYDPDPSCREIKTNQRWWFKR